MNEQQDETMSDTHALRYALEALADLDDHCTSEEQRAELAQVISVMEGLLVAYEKCTWNSVPLVVACPECGSTNSAIIQNDNLCLDCGQLLEDIVE